MLRTIPLFVTLAACGLDTSMENSHGGGSSTAPFNSSSSSTGETDGPDPTGDLTWTSISTFEPEDDSVCGDGVVLLFDEKEECDRGELNNDYSACTTSCKLARCGDGFLQKYPDLHDHGQSWSAYSEECDDGPQGSDTCTPECTLVKFCGDGIVSNPEQCDDGNLAEIDGCQSNCNWTPRYFFVSSKSYTIQELDANPDERCRELAEESLFDGYGTFRALIAHSDGIWTRMNAPYDAVYRNPLDWILFYAPQPSKDPLLNWTLPEELHRLLNPVRVDENGNFIIGYVWTGLNPDGTQMVSPCGNWSHPLGLDAGVGSSLFTTDWFSLKSLDCSESAHLFCVQVF